MSSKKTKLNIGCGGRPLKGYLNVDMDSLDQLRKRYPDRAFSDDITIYPWDIFNLPLEDNSVDEILCEAMIEHLSFEQEPQFFHEIQRVLKPRGIFSFSTTNFEEIVKLWLDAEDDWKDFYRSDDEAIAQKHWFGTYSYGMENRWGYLIASIFGSQNGEGQYHKNCYTIKKIQAILKKLDFKEISHEKFLWKENRDPMIRFLAEKVI